MVNLNSGSICIDHNVFLCDFYATGLIDTANSAPLDGKPILTLSYADGPGYVIHHTVNGTDAPRKNLTNVPRKSVNIRTVLHAFLMVFVAINRSLGNYCQYIKCR